MPFHDRTHCSIWNLITRYMGKIFTPLWVVFFLHNSGVTVTAFKNIEKRDSLIRSKMHNLASVLIFLIKFQLLK